MKTQEKAQSANQGGANAEEEFADSPALCWIGDPDEVPGEWSIPIPYASLAMIAEKIVRVASTTQEQVRRTTLRGSDST